MSEQKPLTADDLARMEHRARRFQGAWTGTAGTLAADVMRLLAERQRLLLLMTRLEDQRDMWRIRGD
jgi:hypothetical protein